MIGVEGEEYYKSPHQGEGVMTGSTFRCAIVGSSLWSCASNPGLDLAVKVTGSYRYR